MPVYANVDDLNAFFSSANISDWADKDRDGSLDADELEAIDKAIEAAEAVVDGYLKQAGYAAPFDASSFSELPERLRSLIRQWTVIIAGFHLSAWRGMRDKADRFEKIYARTIEQLKELAKGGMLAGLEADVKVSFGTGTDQCDPTDQLSHLQSDAWDW